MNCCLNLKLESVFFIFVEENLFILFILVKEVVFYCGVVSGFCYLVVEKVLKDRLSKKD